jgi:nicotinate-nucleotide adenylyltransferase
LGLIPSAPADTPRRIGVFGGAFDPPHNGHLALAQAAVAELQLDVLHIVPTGHAWHKSRELTSPAHRLAMARLAFAPLAQVVIDGRELSRPGPTYTVDTLLELRHLYPEAELFLLLGLDQALVLQTWHRWQEIAQLATICVAARADSTGKHGILDPLLPLFPGLKRLDMPSIAISATDIRSRLARHESIAALVFEPVARYIDTHHLYRSA